MTFYINNVYIKIDNVIIVTNDITNNDIPMEIDTNDIPMEIDTIYY